jgi:hypothetical protein
METVCFSVTLVSTCKYTRPYNPEHQHRYLNRRENFRSHLTASLCLVLNIQSGSLQRIVYSLSFMFYLSRPCLDVS